MVSFSSLKEFLSLLNRERELLTFLFEKRSISMDYNTVVSTIPINGEERMEKLLGYGILTRNRNTVEMEDRILEFFENFLVVNQEVNIASVSEHLESLKNNILYYLAETKESEKNHYLRQIKRRLMNIHSTLIGNIILLSQNVENVYKTESNPKIKRLKLENYRDKRSSLVIFMDELEKLLKDMFFSIVSDSVLEEIVVNLKFDLLKVKDNLLEIQHQIIAYLLNIKKQTAVYEKLQKIKFFRDSHEITRKTNILEVLQSSMSMNFQPPIRLRTNINPFQFDYPETEEILKKILKDIELGKREKVYAEPIEKGYFSEGESVRVILDYERIKEDFLKSGKDLFLFLMGYDYETEVSEMEKVSAFFKIFRKYYDELKIDDEYGYFPELEIEYLKVYRNEVAI